MVYLLLGTGFEEIEAIAPLDLLRRAGVEIATVGLEGKTIYGSHKIGIAADLTIQELDPETIDMIILPGGWGGVASIKACPEALQAVQYAYRHGKWVAAICAAPTILGELGLLDGKEATCYPGCEPQLGGANPVPAAAVTDGRVITGTSAGCAIPFGLALIAALKGPEVSQAIANQIVIR